MTSECVYLGEETKEKKFEHPVYLCNIYERCIKEGHSRRIASCEGCSRKLTFNHPDFVTLWKDPLLVTDRFGNKTHALQGIMEGCGGFLMGGGPSANKMPLELLNTRGCWTLAVNNVGGHARVRPQAFVCSDPPMKFSHSIWFDPGIRKFVPTPKLTGRRAVIRQKFPDGTFKNHEKRVPQCPEVWGFQRSSWLTPDDRFLLENGAMWGNQDFGVKKTGQPKTVCTMLLGLRLMCYLGFRKIYLVGCDFYMRPDWGYSFEQGRTEEACNSNNRQFSIVNQWLCELQQGGVFAKFGIEIFNCYERSGLRAFPYVPFEEAVLDVKGVIEDTPDLFGWYEKVDKVERK